MVLQWRWLRSARMSHWILQSKHRLDCPTPSWNCWTLVLCLETRHSPYLQFDMLIFPSFYGKRIRRWKPIFLLVWLLRWRNSSFVVVHRELLNAAKILIFQFSTSLLSTTPWYEKQFFTIFHLSFSSRFFSPIETLKFISTRMRFKFLPISLFQQKGF